jgi:GNAT superfamily N-acetyltransferase
MKNQEPPQFTVSELTAESIAHVVELEACLGETHPTYEPYFRRVVTEGRRDDGTHGAQVFMAVCSGHAVGFSQVFYREWNDLLVAWLDVLGVDGRHRRQGVGLALVEETLSAAHRQSSARAIERSCLLTAVDPRNVPVVQLHLKLGAQIREDLYYRTPFDSEGEQNILVWYPPSGSLAAAPSQMLAWQAWQIGGLPRGEFVKRYGEPEDVEPAAARD